MVNDREIDERIAKCEKILSSNPGSQIFAALAEAHRKKGELDTAFDVCQKGLKSHPEYGSAHVVMAKINIDKGLYDWAESEVEKAAKLGGNAHAIEALRCEVFLSKGETAEAVSRIKKQLRLNPQNAHLERLLKRAESSAPQASFPSMGDTNPLPKKSSPLPDPFLNKSRDPVVSAAEPAAPKGAFSADPLLDDQTVVDGSAKFSIHQLFDELFAVDGVYGVFLLDSDGTALESRWDGIGSEEEHIVLATTTADHCVEALERIPFGDWSMILVDTPRLALYLVSNGDERVAIFAGEKANRNRMRVVTKRVFGDYTGRKPERGA